MGYDAVGITPDDKQIAFIGDRVPVQRVRYEDYDGGAFDTIIFQESSQYIDANAVFANARAPHVIVLDEFSLRPVDFEGALHSLEEFLDAASRHGFRVVEDLDLSEQAAPTPVFRGKMAAPMAAGAPVAQGEETLSVTVHVSWAIKGKE